MTPDRRQRKDRRKQRHPGGIPRRASEYRVWVRVARLWRGVLMGREIRRVPVGFDWPLEKIWHGFLPDPGIAEWDDDREEYVTPTGKTWTRFDPPSGDGWQVWETVSEGSPITPVFATDAELVDYLATKGTTWDQRRQINRPAKGPWRREAAEAFVRSGWAPSFVISGNLMFDGARDADGIEAIR